MGWNWKIDEFHGVHAKYEDNNEMFDAKYEFQDRRTSRDRMQNQCITCTSERKFTDKT